MSKSQENASSFHIHHQTSIDLVGPVALFPGLKGTGILDRRSSVDEY